ncbi:MAG: hypothetical protein AB1295_00090 [Candidatus Micrarchaeota archaeon]
MKPIERQLKKHGKRAVLMAELPADGYLDRCASSVKALTGQGFSGVYVSFQRPSANLASILRHKGIDLDQVRFVDAASSLGGEKKASEPSVIRISKDIDIDELERAIYLSLDAIKGQKRFIFVDSLTTITLHKPLSESMRFFDFLTHTVRKGGGGDLVLILNVAKELAQKRFIADIAVMADAVFEA